ncbi:MAG: hypothetical protein ACK50P_09855, partial [Planctomycetaceae bacterium]
MPGCNASIRPWGPVECARQLAAPSLRLRLTGGWDRLSRGTHDGNKVRARGTVMAARIGSSRP